VQTEYEKNGFSLTGNVEVNLENASERALTLGIEDRSYGAVTIIRELAAGHRTSIVLDLSRSHGWYDFSVNVVNAESVGRYAGRVDTGRSSFSDPLMGGVA
jgi:phospholipase C